MGWRRLALAEGRCMIRELLISVASGLIVAFVLEAVLGRRRHRPTQSQSQVNHGSGTQSQSQSQTTHHHHGGGVEAPRREGGTARRIALAVLAGVGVALIAVQVILWSGVGTFGWPGTAGLAAFGTLLVWAMLSGSARR